MTIPFYASTAYQCSALMVSSDAPLADSLLFRIRTLDLSDAEVAALGFRGSNIRRHTVKTACLLYVTIANISAHT